MPDAKRVGVGVGVILLKEGKVLLGRRHDDPEKSGPELSGEGTWTIPGGKVEYGETLEETAKREVLEETGIIVRAASVVCVNSDKDKDAHFITIGLVSSSFVGEAHDLAPDEVTNWGWFSLAALPDPIWAPARNVLDCYLAERVSKS